MVAGPNETPSQSEVIFVIECTATNGLYFNEIKTNYLVPTLEYFHGGMLEEGSIGACTYAAVICRAADIRPAPTVTTLGPYKCPHQFLGDVNKLQFIGGRAEGNICLAEALSVALKCFEDLTSVRRSVEVPTKHVIIMCASPPYTAAAGGIPGFGYVNTAEEAATLLGERGVNVSVITPRKLNSLIKIFERSGGELSAASARQYAKDARHMVLLRGLALQERVPSPAPPPQPDAAPTAASMPTHDMYRCASPRGFPGNYRPAGVPPTRWLVGQQSQRPYPPQSALLSQLREPAYTPRDQFAPRGVCPNVQQGQISGPAGLMPGSTGAMGPGVGMGGPGQMGASPNSMGGPAVSQSGPAGPSTAGQGGPGPQASGLPSGRQYIWQGTLEWTEKGKPGDQQKITRQVACSVSVGAKDSDGDLKAEMWPRSLMMQLMPKQVIGTIGGKFLKDSKSVIFHPQPCEALESLTKVLIGGFAGCVHFQPPQHCEIKVLILLYTPDKKTYLGFIPNDQVTFVVQLKRVIQQQKNQKAVTPGVQGSGGQGSQGGGPSGMGGSNTMGPGGGPSGMVPGGQPGMGPGGQPGMGPGGQSGMGPGGQPGMGPGGPNMGPGVPNMGPGGPSGMGPGGPGGSQQQMQHQNMGGPMGQQEMQGGPPGMMGGMGRPLDDLEVARQQNLEKIQQLQQTLEAAQQQETLYKSQMDIMSHLHAAKQQEQQYKQLEDQRQKQAQLAQMQQQAALQQALRGAAHLRLRGPHIPAQAANPGLRHLLQQQPQYRASGPPRPQSQPQQFDDVPNYDFI